MQIFDFQNSPLIPTHFLTVFKSAVNSDLYLESGKITKVGNSYTVGESVPADMDMLTDLVASIKTVNFKSLKFKSLIPKNVLYVNAEQADPVIIWHRAPERRHLEMREGVGNTGTYSMPMILFACAKGSLYSFRMEWDNVEPDSELFYMPLPNIYNDSKVCLGGASRRLKKAKSLEEYMEVMELLFYATDFNALHHKNFGKDVVFVDVLKEGDLNLFPKVPAKQKTLKALLNELS